MYFVRKNFNVVNMILIWNFMVLFIEILIILYYLKESVFIIVYLGNVFNFKKCFFEYVDIFIYYRYVFM